MENKIHRAVVSAYCTLMLSSAFLTVADGMLFAGSVNGAQNADAAIRNIAAGVGTTGFEGAGSIPRTNIPIAQGAPVVTDNSGLPSVPALIAVLRQTGRKALLDDELARELGLPLNPGEAKVEMIARGIRNGDTVRKIFVPADGIRECLTFIVHEKGGQKLYLMGADGKLKKAIVNTTDGALNPYAGPQADHEFLVELFFWHQRLVESPVALAKNPATGG